MQIAIVNRDKLPAGDIVPEFAYSDLADDVAQQARDAALLIGRHMRVSLQSSAEAGKKLRSMKGLLKHGTFLNWVTAECQIGVRSAEELMRISILWEMHIAHLPQPPLITHTVGTCLASKSACPEVVASIVEEAGQGFTLVLKDVRLRLNAARARRGSDNLRHGSKHETEQGPVLKGAVEPAARRTAQASAAKTEGGDDAQTHHDHGSEEAKMAPRGSLRADPSEGRLESNYRADHAGRVISLLDDLDTGELDTVDAGDHGVIARLFDCAADRIMRKGITTRKQLLDPANREEIEAIIWDTFAYPEGWPMHASIGTSVTDAQPIGWHT